MLLEVVHPRLNCTGFPEYDRGSKMRRELEPYYQDIMQAYIQILLMIMIDICAFHLVAQCRLCEGSHEEENIA